MKITSQVVVFDTADLTAESSFWAGVLGGTVDAEDDWHMVTVDGSARVGVQLAPDHVLPQWPDGAPQKIHLDLWVDDIDAAHEEVMSLGAHLLHAAADSDEPDNFQVYADPAGHPFCLCWIKSAELKMHVTTLSAHAERKVRPTAAIAPVSERVAYRLKPPPSSHAW
jgi:predicted enzyme related to lactoylglutathione lyase